MIRPRTGDFVYSDAEQSVMLDDIATFAQMGVTGVVFGALLPDGAVDVDTTTRVVRAARELELEGSGSSFSYSMTVLVIGFWPPFFC